jgi:hypothetical protein
MHCCIDGSQVLIDLCLWNAHKYGIRK